MTTGGILLVEDSRDDVDLVLRALQLAGVTAQVEVARDGAAAIEHLFPEGDTGPAADLPGVILLDLKLPRLDGLEVLRHIRRHQRTALLPVVIFTSSDEPRDLLDAYRLGANSFVRKPVSFEDLIDATRQIATYWLGLNEPAVEREPQRL